MANTFLVSDTHFGHKNICNFLREDGTKVRPWTDVDVMDKDMIELWNDTVRPCDKVYHLGDVVINRRCLIILEKLHGDKVLIKGNHDIFKLSDYTPYFRDIRAYHVFDGYVLSHAPIHPYCQQRFKGNIHGHLHQTTLEDKFYQNVCVELTNYKPIAFSEVIERYENKTKKEV